MSNAIFCSTILQEQKKAGDLPMDKDGYREMVIGGLDVFNDIGELYVASAPAVALFSQTSDFMQRVKQSYLRGEATHPARAHGEPADAFLQRALSIDLKNTTHHFNNIRLEPGTDERGRKVLFFIGSFKPSGMKGPAFEMMCKNLQENIAMSIRCFTKPVTLSNGTVGKEIHHPVTFDLVNEPGIAMANKFDSPSMESGKSDIIVTPELIEMVESNSCQTLGFEDASEHARMVRTSLGWQKTQIISVCSSTNWGR